MAKPFDFSKFRKDITKSIEGLSIGFNDPTDWISTGNYALNYLISGDFNKGVPLGKVTVFAGESGAGKSFICSGNLVRHAQQQGPTKTVDFKNSQLRIDNNLTATSNYGWGGNGVTSFSPYDYAVMRMYNKPLSPAWFQAIVDSIKKSLWFIFCRG